MRRILGLLIALAIPTVILGIAALVTYRPGLPDMAQNTLDHYLSYLRKAGHPAVVLSVRTAAYPFSFTAASSGPTFGDGIYYQVSSADTAVATLSNPAMASAAITYSLQLTPMASPFSGQRPMPYPPEEIWCVQLQPEGAGTPRVVLVALHQDNYNASWAVHELSPATPADTLARVGCPAP